jgi:hypothetical protein
MATRAEGRKLLRPGRCFVDSDRVQIFEVLEAGRHVIDSFLASDLADARKKMKKDGVGVTTQGGRNSQQRLRQLRANLSFHRECYSI